LEIASVVAEYPPGPAGTVQSIVVSGFRSGYHQRRVPAAVPMVTLVQVRLDPSTPRALATMPARPHSSPAFAFDEGTFAALAEVVPDITSAKEVNATAVAVSVFFKDIISPSFFSRG
jgi:hypothetical protein